MIPFRSSFNQCLRFVTASVSMLLFLPAMLSLASPHSRQADRERAIAVLPADQSDQESPLQIVAVTGKAGRDLLEQAAIKNVSAKRVIRYRLGWHFRDAVLTPIGFDAGTSSYGYAAGNPVQASLLPGAKDLSPSQGLLPIDVDRMLNSKGAPQRVLILLGVVEVTFEDGTKWSVDPLKFVRAWRPVSAAKVGGHPLLSVRAHTAVPYPITKCGLCWHTGGIWKCMQQQYIQCTLEDDGSSCTSQNVYPQCSDIP